MKDKLGAQDAVDAGLTTEVTLPEFPCPKCGIGMVDHRTHEEFRARIDIKICYSDKCRAIADWTSGSPVMTDRVYRPN